VVREWTFSFYPRQSQSLPPELEQVVAQATSRQRKVNSPYRMNKGRRRRSMFQISLMTCSSKLCQSWESGVLLLGMEIVRKRS